MLFDLDGTLVDTAPDLVGTLYELLNQLGAEAPEYSQCRNRVSQGVRGLLALAMGITPEDTHYPELQRRFLDIYADRICQQSRLFPGVAQLLADLAKQDIPWVIATNKPVRFTTPLLAQLDLEPTSKIVVTPDLVERGKPHPAMIDLAVERLGVNPAQCWFIGDARQDITAGRGAGVVTGIAHWGYIEPNEPTDDWQADLGFADPAALSVASGPRTDHD